MNTRVPVAVALIALSLASAGATLAQSGDPL
jgi:hypothetical protein